MGLNIVGVSAYYHDAACCLLQDGKLIAAAQEERFSRIKNDPALPSHAFRYCLDQGNIEIDDVDVIAYYELPEKKLSRQLFSKVLSNPVEIIEKLDPRRPEKEIRERWGFEKEIRFFEHHLSHAASAFLYSGFEDAGILTIDGVGEWATTTYGVGRKAKVNLLEEIHFPNSIGLLYSTITSYLGFEVNEGEFKVMGLAPYGKPKYIDQVYEMIELQKGGRYELVMDYFNFVSGKTMYSPALIDLFGQPARLSKEAVTSFHEDVARSLQFVLEEILLSMAEHVFEISGSENLCMAGGVALNCVANGKVLKKGKFKKLFVQPAANDSGGCLGAASLAHTELTGERPVGEKLSHVYLGPAFGSDECERLLQSTSAKYQTFSDTDEQLEQVARDLAEGKVIGWFHGRMEFGPRSLGARSILADPRDETMRDRINTMVKKREGFRPFAPAVLEQKASEHFELDHPSPFMLETCQVTSPLYLPAITHIDGSARVQTVSSESNPKFSKLIEKFHEQTGCPILLNTSFNVKGEPIVCSPEDALKCFITTDIDALVLENFIIYRSDNHFDTLESALGKRIPSGIAHDVYTFI